MDVTQPSDRSAAELEAAHTREAIRAGLESGPSHSDLRDFIFGAIDGTVTTFAVVSGVSEAGLPDGGGKWQELDLWEAFALFRLSSNPPSVGSVKTASKGLKPA